MSLEQLIHSVERQLFLVGCAIFQGGTKSDLVDERQLLQTELAEFTRQQADSEEQLAALRERIADLEGHVTLQVTRIEDSVRRGKSERALLLALELDKTRRDLATERAELPRLEHLCWSLGFRQRQLQRDLQRTCKPMQS